MSDKDHQQHEKEGEAVDSEAVKAYESVGDNAGDSDDNGGETHEAQPDDESLAEGGSTSEHTGDARDAVIEELQTKLDEHREALLRTRAEMDNQQKRAARDIEHARKFALEKFLEKLIPVKDSLEAGAQMAEDESADPARLAEGMELTLKMLEKLMQDNSIEVIDPTGQPFNPQYHEAMTTQPSEDHEPDTVLQVFQRGYLLNGRLIRPARVIVAK